MDGEYGHIRNINLCAKPRTKKPTNSRVQRALSSATGKSHGRGLETSSALRGQIPSLPGAFNHPSPGPPAVKSLGLLLLEWWASHCTLRGSQVWTRRHGMDQEGGWQLPLLSWLIKENELKTKASSQQKMSCVIAAHLSSVHFFRTISVPMNDPKALPSWRLLGQGFMVIGKGIRIPLLEVVLDLRVSSTTLSLWASHLNSLGLSFPNDHLFTGHNNTWAT